MNRVLVSLATRQLLGRKRSLLIALVLALPIVIALIYRFAADPDPGITPSEFALGLVQRLILTLLLPLVALVLGTGAMGAEIEDGTAIFLVTKPIARWRIMIVKIGVASVVTTVLVVPATIATAWIVLGSATEGGIVLGLGLAAAVASFLYCSVFVALGAITTRALVIGLVYVFVWEAVITNLFGAVRWVSIREYALGWSDMAVSVTDSDIYDPDLAAASAVIASVVVLCGAAVLGTRALTNFQIGERS